MGNSLINASIDLDTFLMPGKVDHLFQGQPTRLQLQVDILCNPTCTLLLILWFCQNSEEHLAGKALMEYACGKQTHDEG